MKIGILFILSIIFTSAIYAKEIQLGHKRISLGPKLQPSKSSLSIMLDLHHGDLKKMTKNGINYKLLTLPNAKITSFEGGPQLPYFSYIVAAAKKDLVYTISKGSPVTLDNFLPMPAPKNACRCDKDIKEKFVFNDDLYGAESKRKNLISIESLGDFRGTSLSKVTIYPHQYDFSHKSITLYPHLEVKLEHRNNIALKRVGPEFVDIQQVTEEKINNKYLIVTPEKFKQSLSEFIEWKQKLGYQVDVITLESIGTTFSEIKSFLKNRYKNEKNHYTYALLVGHEGLIPTQYVKTQFDSKTPSDLAYFTMGDASDFIPDVYYGRFVVDKEEELINQIKKTIDYEWGIPDAQSGYDHIIGIASNEGGSNNSDNNEGPWPWPINQGGALDNLSDKQYISMVSSIFKNNRPIKIDHFFQDDQNSNYEQINDSLAIGSIWITYMGHGSGTSWDSLTDSKGYRNTHLKYLSSTPYRPIIIDVSCQNGRFEYNPASGGRLGERWMNQADMISDPLGAVAYYGGSVNISWYPPAKMAVGVANEYFSKDLTYLGETLLAGQIFMMNNHDQISQVKENFIWYHLLGDPSLKMRTKMPTNAKVVKQGDYLVLYDSSNNILKNLPVTFYSKKNHSELFETTFSDSNGKVLIPSVLDYDHFSFYAKDHYFIERKLDF